MSYTTSRLTRHSPPASPPSVRSVLTKPISSTQLSSDERPFASPYGHTLANSEYKRFSSVGTSCYSSGRPSLLSSKAFSASGFQDYNSCDRRQGRKPVRLLSTYVQAYFPSQVLKGERIRLPMTASTLENERRRTHVQSRQTRTLIGCVAVPLC